VPSQVESITRSLEVAAELLAVRELAAFLHETCALGGLNERDTLDLELAMVEAATNVVEHGYGTVEGGLISLQISIADSAARLILADHGKPIPDGAFAKCRIVDWDALDGRGISIVQSCVDEIDYSSDDGCNRLSLRKRLTS
jgi:serine/threonine-protein kinase RsbW